jgi:hypothetical protein
MLNVKVLANAAFATVTVLSLGFTGHSVSASAQSISVTRGPHGAVSIVDKVPVGATALPMTPSLGNPTLVTRGPNGASQVVEASKEAQPLTQAHSIPNLTSFGPHSASHIVN